MTESSQPKSKKEMPLPIKMAIDYLASASDIDPSKKDELAKTLPAFAMQLAKNSEDVTPEKLAAFARGEIKTEKKQNQEQTVFEIFKRITGINPKPEKQHIKTGRGEMVDAAANGDEEFIRKKVKWLEEIKKSMDDRESSAIIPIYLKILSECADYALRNGQINTFNTLLETLDNSAIVSFTGKALADLYKRSGYGNELKKYISICNKHNIDFNPDSYLAYYSHIGNFVNFLIDSGELYKLDADNYGLTNPEYIEYIRSRLTPRLEQEKRRNTEWVKITRDAAPMGLLNYHPAGVPMSVLKNLSDLFNAGEEKNKAESNVAAYNAALLFQSEERAIQFFNAHIRQKNDPAHPTRKMRYFFEGHHLPFKNRANIDFKAWGDAILKHGVDMLEIFKECGERMLRPALSDDGKTWSLEKTRDMAAVYKYARGTENPSLAALFNKCSMGEDAFDHALRLIERHKKEKIKSDIPNIEIKGKDFGMSNAIFKKLPDGDPRGLVLGQLTDCCQHLEGDGAKASITGFLNPKSGFYIVSVPGKHGEEEIIGQAWAWIGKKNELVLDSLETLGQDAGHARIKEGQWKKILEQLKSRIDSDHPDIKALRVGTGGNTRNVGYKLIDYNSEDLAHPKGDFEAYDARSRQYAVWERKERKPAKKSTSPKTDKTPSRAV